MSDLLTRDEYAALAGSIQFPRTAFIDGGFRAGKGAKLPTVNPATGETITEIAGCNAEDVDLAVSKAREAFDQGRWSKLHPSERKDVLIRLCKLMTRNPPPDSGSPHSTARFVLDSSLSDLSRHEQQLEPIPGGSTSWASGTEKAACASSTSTVCTTWPRVASMTAPSTWQPVRLSNSTVAFMIW